MTSNWLTVLAMVVTTTAPAWADDHPIDRVLDTAQGERGVKPAPICADEVFLRRVYLDLIGRIPTLSERTRFLNQPDTLDQPA